MKALVSSVCFRVFDTDGDGFLSRSEIEVMCKALIDIRKENNVGEKARFLVWTAEMFLNSIYLGAFIFSGNIPMTLPHNSQGVFVWDDLDQDHWLAITRIMVDQMNRWIHLKFGQGFISSLFWSTMI